MQWSTTKKVLAEVFYCSAENGGELLDHQYFFFFLLPSGGHLPKWADKYGGLIN